MTNVQSCGRASRPDVGDRDEAVLAETAGPAGQDRRVIFAAAERADAGRAGRSRKSRPFSTQPRYQAWSSTCAMSASHSGRVVQLGALEQRGSDADHERARAADAGSARQIAQRSRCRCRAAHRESSREAPGDDAGVGARPGGSHGADVTDRPRRCRRRANRGRGRFGPVVPARPRRCREAPCKQGSPAGVVRVLAEDFDSTGNEPQPRGRRVALSMKAGFDAPDELRARGGVRFDHAQSREVVCDSLIAVHHGAAR